MVCRGVELVRRTNLEASCKRTLAGTVRSSFASHLQLTVELAALYAAAPLFIVQL